MSLLTTAARGRNHTVQAPPTAAGSGTARRGMRRALPLLLAVALDGAAALLLVSHRLTGAVAGVLLGGLGWLVVRRLAERGPAPQRD